MVEDGRLSCSIEGERCGFACTGYDGSAQWAKMHKTAEEIPCDSCRDHATKLMKGVHDHVNAGLGKPVFDRKNYAEFADEVACVYASCVKEGRC